MVKTYTEKVSIIKSKSDLRLSPNYYYLNIWFKKIEGKGFDIFDLNSITTYIDSGSYIAEYLDSGIYFVRVGDIKKYVIDESELKFVSKSVKSKSKLKQADIFFGRTQATYSKLGVFAIASERIAGSAVSQHVAKIHIDDEIIDPYYVIAYLNSKFGRSQMVLASYGDTRVEFTNNQISQIRIAKLPDKDYDKIRELSHKVEELNEKEVKAFFDAQSIINDEFDKIIKHAKHDANIRISMLKENDLWTPVTYKKEYVLVRNAIFDNMKFKVITDVIEKITKGVEVGSKFYRTEVETNADSLPFIRTSDIYNGEIDFYPDYFFNSYDNPKVKIPLIKENDIIFSKDGKIGQCSIANKDDKFIPGSGYFILRPKKDEDPNYLFALLSNNKIIKYQALMKTVIASTIPHLKDEKFKTILVPYFEDEVVNKVSSLISTYRDSLILKNKYIKEIQNIFDKYYFDLFE